MSSKIEDRLILILSEDGEPYGYWQALEKTTGISAQRWRGVIARRQRPTPDMIETVAKMFPEFAFWLVTGVTDIANGHTAPQNAFVFPERYKISSGENTDYFRLCLKLNLTLSEEANLERMTDEDRLESISNIEVGKNRWIPGGLTELAYDIASTTEYQNLKKCARLREEVRQQEQKQIWPEKRESHTDGTHSKGDEELVSSKNILVDKRTMHQSNFDIFWEPKEFLNQQRFAKSVLNIKPSKLNDENIDTLKKWLERECLAENYEEIINYLEAHQIPSYEIFGNDTFPLKNLKDINKIIEKIILLSKKAVN